MLLCFARYGGQARVGERGEEGERGEGGGKRGGRFVLWCGD